MTRLGRSDLGLPLAFLAGWLVELVARGGFGIPLVGELALVALFVLPLALHRRAPLVTFAGVLIVVGAWTAAIGSDNGPWMMFPSALASGFASGSRLDARQARWAGWSLLPYSMAISLLTGDGLAGGAAFAFLLLGMPFVAGRSARRHRVRAAELEQLVGELEREREETARLAVLAERARIGAELNGVVAHGLAEMLIQAGAAASLLERDPSAAQSALRAVQESGGRTVDVLRRMLQVLRTSTT